MVGLLVVKPSVREPRPLLGYCCWDCDSYEKQTRGDPKSQSRKSRAGSRKPAEGADAVPAAACVASRPAAWVSPYCGSAVSNRRLLGPAPARSAAREAREPPLRARARSRPGLRPLPSALGQRLPKELRVRERSGKWRLLSHPGAGEAGRRGRGGSGKGGEEAELVRSPSRGSRTSGGRAR